MPDANFSGIRLKSESHTMVSSSLFFAKPSLLARFARFTSNERILVDASDKWLAAAAGGVGLVLATDALNC